MNAAATDRQSDRLALERIAAGDSAAVADCIALYGRLVWSLARRFTRTAMDAEDATQEIFVSLWTHANAFDRARGSELGFVATIARRRLIDRHRRAHAEPTIDASIDVTDAPDSVEAGSTYHVQLDARIATRLLQRMRPDWREVLELGLLDGLTQSEISERLKMPLGTVKSHMRRGIQQIRRQLQTGSRQRPAPTQPAQRNGGHDRLTHLAEGRPDLAPAPAPT